MPEYAMAIVVRGENADATWESVTHMLRGDEVLFVGDPRPIRESDDYDSEEVARTIILHDLPDHEYERKEPASDDG